MINFLLNNIFAPACQILRIEGGAWSAQRIPTAVNIDVLDPEALLFHSEQEWTPVQSHYFSEILVTPGIEPGTSGSVANTSDY
jgi:hypothetical protein